MRSGISLSWPQARSAAGLPPRTVDATVDATVIVTARRQEPVVEPCLSAKIPMVWWAADQDIFSIYFPYMSYISIHLL